MKKITLLSAIFVLSLLVAACQPSVDEAKADFCSDLGEFGQALVGFRQLNPASTKDDLNKAESDVQKAWDNLQSSASTLKDVQTSSVQDAFETLKKDIGDIPDDTTLADTELMIKDDVVSTMGETLQIFSTTCTYGQDSS